jgi:hypothetical protein
VPRIEQWIRPTPGRAAEKVWVNLSDADFDWYCAQYQRILETAAGSPERTALIDEVYAVVELNYYFGARGLSDEEVAARGLEFDWDAPRETPAGASQEPPGAAPAPPAIDTSTAWGAAAARLWEAQAERSGFSAGSSPESAPVAHEQVSLFADAEREENLVRLDELKRAVHANTPGKKHADAHPTEQAAALKAAGRTGSQRRLIFDAIGAAGERGLTDEEIAVVPDVADTAHRTRRNELVTAGLVADSGKTRKTESGSDSIVWVLTALGREVMAA